MMNIFSYFSTCKRCKAPDLWREGRNHSGWVRISRSNKEISQRVGEGEPDPDPELLFEGLEA